MDISCIPWESSTFNKGGSESTFVCREPPFVCQFEAKLLVKTPFTYYCVEVYMEQTVLTQSL